MKLDCGPTREERRKARFDLLRSWHTHFAWLPIRVGPRECRWLERIERRGTFHHPRMDFMAGCTGWWEWEYRPLTP